jgi:predicted S18 family serine protease
MSDKSKNFIEKKDSKVKKQKKTYLFSKTSIIIKLLIVILFVYGYCHINSSFENKVSLLAVNENANGEVFGGSLIELTLKIKPGSGQTYVNLNTIEEVDTQISIINSQKIACELFEKNCEKSYFSQFFSNNSHAIF